MYEVARSELTILLPGWCRDWMSIINHIMPISKIKRTQWTMDRGHSVPDITDVSQPFSMALKPYKCWTFYS